MGRIFSVRPLIAGIGSFWRARDLLDCAIHVQEIAPAVERETPPAIALPGEFENVFGTVPSTSVSAERDRLSASSIRHGPTLCYGFRDALLGNRTIYTAGTYGVYGLRSRRIALAGNCEEFDQGQMCTHAILDRYFGHWLREGLGMELLAEHLGRPPLSFRRPAYFHEEGYREVTQLPGYQVELARVRELWIPDNRGLNDAWVHRFKELRARVRTMRNGTGPSCVFMFRGNTGASREIANEPEIVDALVSRGFALLNPEASDVNEVVRTLADAKLVVSIEGSSLNHAQYSLAEGAGILTIQAPYFFNAAHKLFADATGLRFGYVVGDRHPAGFSLDVAKLLRTIDLMHSQPS